MTVLVLAHSLQVTLWDAQCKPIFDFGSGPYNMVRWNPFGRFLVIAGFGNLPGEACLLLFHYCTNNDVHQDAIDSVQGSQ